MTLPPIADLLRPGTIHLFKRDIPVTLHDAGVLRCPTGRIIATDPFCWSNNHPFDRAIPPGDYRVQLAVGNAQGEDGCNLAAILRISDAPVASWEVANFPYEHADEGWPPAYGVDVGVGAFVDAAVLDLPPNDTDIFEPLMQALEASGPAWQHASFAMGKSSDLPLIAFSTAMGDGSFVSYWGLDAAGQPCVLVTDLVDRPVLEAMGGKW